MGNAELSLEEMLNDPIVRLRMDSDRVRPDNVRECVEKIRQRLRDRKAAQGMADRGCTKAA